MQILHQRQKIRQTVCDNLKNNTIAKDRVFAMRKLPLFQSELPCILVYTTSETASKFNESPREMERKLQLSIAGIVQSDDKTPESQVENTLDSLALSIETALNNNRYLDDNVSDSMLTNTDIHLDANGDKLTASIILNYEITYYTSACSQTALPDFQNMTIDYQSQHVAMQDTATFPDWLKLK